MKKLSLFLVFTMLISIFAAMPVVQADETAFPDYSSWDYTTYDTVTVDGTNNHQWVINRPYQDLVIEFDITLTEVSGKVPKMWYRLRKGTPNYAGEMYVTNTAFDIVTDWNSTDSYIWGNLNTGLGIFDTYATKKMRISSIGATYIVEQNVNNVWTRVGEFTDPNYDASTAGTQLQIATGAQNPFKLENIKIYKYEEPITVTPFVDYSAWELKEEVASASGSVNASTKWVSSGSYDDFVMEYTISATGNSGFGVWYNFRMNSTSPSRMFAQANSLVTEKTWGGYNYETMSTEYGILGTSGAEHKMRISAIGSVYTVEEYINNAWVRVGEYTDDGTSAAGPINFGGHQAGTTFTLKDIKIYQYVEPVVVTPFVDYSAWELKEEVASASGSVNASTKWVSSGSYDDFVMEYTISATGNSGFGVWYNFRMNSTSPSRMFAQANSLVTEKTWGGYNYETMSTEYGILGTSGAEHKMRISAIGSVYTVEEYINNAWVRVGEYTDDGTSAAGPINFGGHQAGTTFTLKDIKIYQYVEPVVVTPFVDYSALTAKESVASLNGSTSDGSKFSSSYNYENFVIEFTVSANGTGAYGMWWNFRDANPANANSRMYVDTTSIKTEKTWGGYDYETMSTEYGILGNADSSHKIRISAIGKVYTVEEEINGEWIRVGEYTDNVESAAGPISLAGVTNGSGTIVTNFTLTNLAIYELQNLTLTPGAISSAAEGTQITFTADRAVATIPETLTITDGVSSFNASAAAGSSDTEVVVTLTDTLDWSTEYTIDLSGVMDAYGIGAKSVSFTTPDEPNGYVVGEAVFYKADATTVIYAVEAGTLKVKRNVTRTIDTAATKVTLVTALYKTVGDITYMIDADVTESDVLALNTAADLWGEITVPSDGAAYSIRTFVWQDMINCNPVATPSDM